MNEIYISGEIGPDTNTVAELRREVEAINSAGQIDLYINSPGGDAFEGVAVYEFLNRLQNTIIVHVDGLAASAASIIAMAGTRIEMGEGAMVMIHDASALTIGDAGDHSKSATILEKLSNQIANIYATRTGLDKSKIISMMNEETWMNAEEAVQFGFADAIVRHGRRAMPTNLDPAKFGYRNAPQALFEQNGPSKSYVKAKLQLMRDARNV